MTATDACACEYELAAVAEAGLSLRATPAGGLAWPAGAVRVELAGAHLFRVWGWQDSGEELPAWAEPALQVALFGDDTTTVDTLTRGGTLVGWRAMATHARASAELLAETAGGELSLALTVRNPQPHGGQPLPLGQLTLRLGGLPVGPAGAYLSAHGYGGYVHGAGRCADLDETGLSFISGCIGLALPLLYLYDARTGAGWQVEFMLDGRPELWLRRPAGGDAVELALRWPLDRVLAPGEAHTVGGRLRLRPYRGDAVAMMQRWRDAAAARHGLRSPRTPDWARRMNIIEFDTCPQHQHHPFKRLDDPRVRELLATWRDWGYTAIFTVGHNHTQENWLSPLDYVACDAAGGPAAEQQYLAWARELGFHVFLWVTTVGMDKNAREATARLDWWTQRRNGQPFFAWDSTAQTNYVGYAPDADPFARGWREWLGDQIAGVIRRGYHGVYIDGCIPRASNHARWDWPGKGRDGVPDLVMDLARQMRARGDDLILFVEDEGLYAQASCEVTQGRYFAGAPFPKAAFAAAAAGAGPRDFATLPRLAPELAREYLRVRYASLLPGVVSNDMAEGYYREATRPWWVQSLLAGMVPKTHSNFVDYGGWRTAPDFPLLGGVPAAEAAAAHRERAFAEFLALLRLCRDEPLLRDAPRSLDAVVVDGDAAVVGLLRPGAGRSLLALLQFADRAATVRVSLREAGDMPPEERAEAGDYARGTWTVRELARSLVDDPPAPPARLGPGEPLLVALATYGFRLFELRRA